jgi:pimeloyl-ACP methyl ester carboxylesterase
MAAATTPTKARNVVLVHGLFADGSCWSEVIARLQAAGLNSTAVQNPLTTLLEAVASAQRVLARQDGPTVLVGHSFSGMIVTGAGTHSNVSALVYVAARAPDAGEDYAALAKRFPTPPASAGIIFDGDEGRLSEEVFLRDFAGDLPAAKAKVLYAVQQPFQKSLLTGRTTQAAWRSKPSFYAVSTQDRTINPDLERFMAKRMGAKTIEVMASHLSLLTSRRDYQADPGSRTAGLTRGQSRLTLSGATAFLRLRTIGRLSSRPAVRASRTSHRGIDG